MKIVILTGSPRRKGDSTYLAERFTDGAIENGHEVYRFDAAFKHVHGCIACNHCGMNGPCVFKDDFAELRQKLIEADAVVFATPMYYFGMSSQLKTVVDRFYSINDQIKGQKKKVFFLLTYAEAHTEDAQAMLQQYRSMTNYLGWVDCGKVIAPHLWEAGAVCKTNYGKQAYLLAKSGL